MTKKSNFMRKVCALGLASLFAHCVRAAIADTDVIRITAADVKSATWSNDSATINGCTVNLNGNTKNENGTISIITTASDGETAVDKGVTIDVPTADGKYTAIVKYSNYTRSTSAYTYTLGMACNRDSDYGITDNSGTYRGFYSTSRHYSFGNNPAAKAAGYLMISYHNASGTACYVGETPKGYAGGVTSSIKWANSTVSGINIGGKRTAQPDDFLKPVSMTIEEVILVKGVYSQDTGSLDDLKTIYASKEVVQKYGYDFNGTYAKGTTASAALTLGGSINDSDCQVDGVHDKALSFATGRTSNYWGTSFSYGAGDWTLIASVKASAANQCILSVGGNKGTTGVLGLRNAGNNAIAAFTKDGADLTSVTLDSDPTTSYHVYAIVYDSTSGKVKMNVDGGAFTDGVDFTPSTSGGFQFGGIYQGQIAGIAANATSGALDEFRFYSTALTQADTQELAGEWLDFVAKIGEKNYLTLASALAAATEGQTVELLGACAETVEIPEGVTVATTSSAQFTGVVAGAGRIVFDAYWPVAATQTNLKDATKWTGTVELKNIPSSLSGNSFGILPFQNVGNAQSTIAMNGVTSTCFAANTTYPAITVKAIEILDGGLTLAASGNFSTTDMYAANLTGSGTLTVTGTGDTHGQACFKGDHSLFTGSVVVGEAAHNKRVVFLGSTENAPGNSSEWRTIYVSSGSTMTVAQTATWTAPGGIKVDGTLRFADEKSTSGHCEHWMNGALTGSGTIDASECTSAGNGSQVRIIFKGGDDSFGGTIKVKNNVHVVFTTADQSSTGMVFSGQGQVCVEHGKATLASGANWGVGGTGVLAWNSDSTIVLAGGTVTGNLFMNSGSNLEFPSLATKGATITGALTKNGNGKINVKLPTTATSEEMTLLSFGSTSLTTDAFNVTEGPTGFVLAIEDKQLKLKSASDITTEVTKTVSDQSSEGWVSLGSGGVYTVNGLGGLKIDTLKLKEGSKLVLDPVRTPLLATKLEVSGATTIKLASVWADHADEYATIDCGKFHLVTYPNTITIDPALITIEGLKDGVDKSLEIVDVADSNYKQLVLKVGNYDENGKVVKLTQFGDSITEGIWRSGYIGTPNYRIPLMHRLEAHGYKPQTTGFRGDNLKNSGVYGSSDANGVPAEPQYRLHNGISAQRVFTGNTGGSDRAGFIEGIEAYLEASGDEQDVITIKIGTNDTIGGEEAARIFEGWKKLINRLIKERPTARIVVTSILPLVPEGQMTRGGQYSEMIKAAVEDGTTFPANTVFYVDCRTACPKGEGNFLSDNVHPNWKGYNHMADQWLGGVMSAYAASTGKTYTPNTNTGVEANVPAEYRKGFVKVASMDLNQIKKDISAWGDSPYTTIDTELAAKEAVKIAYYVERSTTTSAKNQFVWVDMDPWTDAKTAASMGVPADMQVNKIVNNLHIVSNLDEIRTVEPTTDGVKGTLLFTNKKANPDKGIAEGPDTKFGMDWNDTIDGNTNYGVMNVSCIYEGATATTHRYALGQTLFSYNGFNDGRTNVLGIGDFAVHCQQSNGNSAVNPLTLNWVSPGDNFTKMNADCLDNGIIEIWVKLPVVTIEIPAAPTGAEVEVTVDGEVVDASSGSIEAAPGAEIEVAYFAARDYNMDDVVFTFVAGEESTIDISQVVPVAKVYVAQLGNVKYETLQDAIDDAEDGDTVYLTADTTESIYNEFADITLHLNEGATLTGKTWFTLFNYQHTLTIEGDGAIKGVASDPNPIIAVYNQAGTVNITGGTIEAKNYVIYETESAKTVVTGGKFNLNPGPWLPGGYTTSKTSDGKYYIVETLSYVAKIGEVEYDTLAEAIEAAQAGQLIELACPTDETIAFDKDFVLVIKNNGFNYGTIKGAKAEYKRLEGQYTAVANYVMFSKSMEDLVDYVTTNDSKYTGGHGRFYIYDNWTLTKNVRIPARGGATQSIFTVQDEFVLDLNGFTLDQQPIVDKAGKSSGHGGYPTIVADYGKKVTIKDTSAEQNGILCGWGWPVDVYDNPRSCVVLESGTITTHGGQHPNTEKYPTSHGRVIRMMGGSFIMNGGAITLEHLEEGHQIFGIITAQTGEASKHNIEINGGYIQCATAEQLWDPEGTDQPNCLIGGSKGSTAAVEITGGSFSIVPPKTYFAEGLDAVVDENGHFHIQQVIHEGEEVTIAVSDDGEKLAPTVPEEGSVEIIAPDETKVYVIDIANQEAPAALYQVVTKDAEGEVVSTSNIGVVKVQEAVAVKKTIAVAVPFAGATVENLLNTKLLNEGDELKAYSNGAYSMWSLDATGKWVSAKTVKAGGTETAPNAETTPLKRGTAVWVTTAGQVVTLGTFDKDAEIATADETVNLLANPTMEAFEPEAELVGDQVIETGVDHVRYTVVKQGGAKTWRCSTTIRKTVDGEVIDSEKIETKAPSIRVGRGYWMMKKSQETK